ncbi:hypothetical protein DL769_006250 [Monosporascus sp. CRB-8-3]|nr:hypothetical protein DL769_006250 [Monosporascus sp. CRB-8-3]
MQQTGRRWESRGWLRKGDAGSEDGSFDTFTQHCNEREDGRGVLLCKVPTLHTALSAGDLAKDPAVYGSFTNAFVLDKDDVVQIAVNNIDSGCHPFTCTGTTSRRSTGAAGVPARGNAAGGAADLLDLTGENRVPDPPPDGGKAALAFSRLSGVLCVLVVAWCGLAPDPGSQRDIGQPTSDAPPAEKDAGRFKAASASLPELRPVLITSVSRCGSSTG